MASRTLVIHLATGEPRTGIWCDGCLTSARYEVDFYRLTDDGPRPFGRTIRRCHRCDDDA
jgi:hypothetical protein